MPPAWMLQVSEYKFMGWWVILYGYLETCEYRQYLSLESLTGLLLEHFKRGWLIELHAVPPSPDMARSALQPIFVRAEKMMPGQKPSGSNICSIVRNNAAPNAEQLDEICQASINWAFCPDHSMHALPRCRHGASQCIPWTFLQQLRARAKTCLFVLRCAGLVA